MTDAGRRARFSQETKPRRFVTEIFFADDLQCHGAAQIDVERFVCDAHRAATQLDRPAVLALHQFVMLKSEGRLLRYRRERFFRRSSGLGSLIQSPTENTDRTKLSGRGELRAANQACASVVHVSRI